MASENLDFGRQSPNGCHAYRTTDSTKACCRYRADAACPGWPCSATPLTPPVSPPQHGWPDIVNWSTRTRVVHRWVTAAVSSPSTSSRSAAISLHAIHSGPCRFLIAMILSSLPAHNMGRKTPMSHASTDRGQASSGYPSRALNLVCNSPNPFAASIISIPLHHWHCQSCRACERHLVRGCGEASALQQLVRKGGSAGAVVDE